MTCQEGGLKRESALSGLVQRWKNVACNQAPIRRGGRVAEGARLESVFTGNRNVGSNPTPSANICSQLFAHPGSGDRSSSKGLSSHGPGRINRLLQSSCCFFS